VTGEVSLDPLRWGLIPHRCRDPDGGRKPINAKAETVAKLPTFRDADARRRCILPVDGFFEWKAIKGVKAKQPFAIARRNGAPFRHRRHLEAINGVAKTACVFKLETIDLGLSMEEEQ
jgi:putative SOS response-associated peptidase YedK